MATQIYSLTEGHTRFCEMVRDAEATCDRYVLTRDGKPKAVLMSYEEYEGVRRLVMVHRVAHRREICRER